MNSKYNLKNAPFFARFNVQFTKLNVNENAKAIQCHLCKYWVHIECDHLNYIDFKYFQGSDDPWFYATCCSAFFLFASLNKNCFLLAISCDRFNKNNENQKETKDTLLLLNPLANLGLFLTNLITLDLK